MPFLRDFATWRAASAVELAATAVASGRCFAIHIRVWPNGFGWETTVVMSDILVPGATQRWSDTGRSTSCWTSSSVSKARVSRVTVIDPSIEFSMGTIPRSTSPFSTAVITCGTSR